MSENPRPLTGLLRLVAASAIILIATLAMLMLFDVIPQSAFTELSRKILLAGCVVTLAGVGLAFLGAGEGR